MVLLYIILAVPFVYGLYEFVFWLFHRRPLTEDEIVTLASVRRRIDVNRYFNFSRIQIPVNREFKSSMHAKGKFYKVSVPLSELPAYAAALLKGKKHEWIIIAFEKSSRIEYLWINKGFDNQSASILISVDNVADFAIKDSFSTVLMFHNHPNSNPNQYSYSQASPTDLRTADLYSSTLAAIGISHIAFVCERGMFFKYFSNYSDTFMPVNGYIQVISCIDNSIPANNYHLHKELRRHRNIQFQ
jgi:hypothetical protein